jgi:hypothetical protein
MEKRARMRGSWLAAFFAAALAAFLCGGISLGASRAFAATVVVDGDDNVDDTDGCGGGADTAADPCNTIQAGVDHAASGDTIDVRTSATHYFESVLVTKPDVHIVGPQAGVPGYERSVPPSQGEAILDGPDHPPYDSSYLFAALVIEANGITVDGLAIVNTAGSGGISVLANGVTIKNNVIAKNGPGIGVAGNDLVVSRNYFSSNGTTSSETYYPYDIYAISSNSGSHDGWTVEDNLFEKTRGFILALTDAGYWNKNMTIAYNDFVDPAIEDGVRIGQVVGGKAVGNLFQNTLLDFTTAKDSSVEANDFWGSDLYFGALNGCCGSYDPTSNTTILGNDFTGGKYGIDIFGNYDGSIDAAYNRFVDVGPVTLQGGQYVLDPKGIVTNGPVAAENNWWGCNGGPEDAACLSAVQGPVDFTPWLVLSTNANPSRLLAPGRTSIEVDLAHDSAGASVSAPELLPPMDLTLTKVAGPGTFLASPTEIDGGRATASFESQASGQALVGAEVDQQTSQSSIVFENPPPPVAKAAAPATQPLTLSNLKVSPSTFAFGRSLPKLARRIGVGTTIQFKLSSDASVTLVFERSVNGRKAGSRCIKRARTSRACNRFTKSGTLTVSGRVGDNRLRFQGRLSRQRTLKPGRYRVTATARDTLGNRSGPGLARFALIRKRRR